MKAMYCFVLLIFSFSVIAGTESYGDALQNEDNAQLSRQWMANLEPGEKVSIFSNLNELKAHYAPSHFEKVAFIMVSGGEMINDESLVNTLPKEIAEIRKTNGAQTKIVFIVPEKSRKSIGIEGFVEFQRKYKEQKELYVVAVVSTNDAAYTVRNHGKDVGGFDIIRDTRSISTRNKAGILIVPDLSIDAALVDIAADLSRMSNAHVEYLLTQGSAADGSIAAAVEFMVTPSLTQKKLILHIGSYEFRDSLNMGFDLAGAALYRFLLENPQLVTDLDLDVQVATAKGKASIKEFAQSEAGRKLQQFFDTLPELVQKVSKEIEADKAQGGSAFHELRAMKSLQLLTSAKITDIVAAQLASFAIRQREIIDLGRKNVGSQTAPEEMARLFTLEASLRRLGASLEQGPQLMAQVRKVSSDLHSGRLPLVRIMKAR